jgi:hypothetical protein
MALPKWREVTVRVIAEKTGPVANLIVEDILSELELSEQDMTASHYIQFIRLLYEKLPATLDRRELCRLAQVAVMQVYGFKNH